MALQENPNANTMNFVNGTKTYFKKEEIQMNFQSFQ